MSTLAFVLGDNNAGLIYSIYEWKEIFSVLKIRENTKEKKTVFSGIPKNDPFPLRLKLSATEL